CGSSGPARGRRRVGIWGRGTPTFRSPWGTPTSRSTSPTSTPGRPRFTSSPEARRRRGSSARRCIFVRATCSWSSRARPTRSSRALPTTCTSSSTRPPCRRTRRGPTRYPSPGRGSASAAKRQPMRRRV
ncbi:MAG: hypothetical protein AVDCRST_MAG59-3185, partial [uncultured Thermomicrobiales bacterium]